MHTINSCDVMIVGTYMLRHVISVMRHSTCYTMSCSYNYWPTSYVRFKFQYLIVPTCLITGVPTCTCIYVPYSVRTYQSVSTHGIISEYTRMHVWRCAACAWLLHSSMSSLPPPPPSAFSCRLPLPGQHPLCAQWLGPGVHTPGSALLSGVSPHTN